MHCQIRTEIKSASDGNEQINKENKISERTLEISAQFFFEQSLKLLHFAPQFLVAC